jgi:hypothetical protein
MYNISISNIRNYGSCTIHIIDITLNVEKLKIIRLIRIEIY